MELFLIISKKETNTDNNKFDFINKQNATRKEIFDNKSILGISIAGKTSKLDAIYITLLKFILESILCILLIISLANNQNDGK